jgi:hypothetical protein
MVVEIMLRNETCGPPVDKVGQDPFEALTHQEDLHHHDQATDTGSPIIQGYDPFDPEAIRMDLVADFEVERVLTAVPVRKPKRTEFIRVHPEFVCDRLLVERDTGMEKECYLVTPEVQHLVAQELRRTRLHVAITKHGTVFLWPIKLPLEGIDSGRRVFETASLIAQQAKTLWVKSVWDRGLGGYEMYRAKGDLGEPQWPDKSFRDLMAIAFGSYLIDRADHEVIRELNGEL